LLLPTETLPKRLEVGTEVEVALMDPWGERSMPVTRAVTASTMTPAKISLGGFWASQNQTRLRVLLITFQSNQSEKERKGAKKAEIWLLGVKKGVLNP
jgi:hypothetical protein